MADKLGLDEFSEPGYESPSARFQRQNSGGRDSFATPAPMFSPQQRSTAKM